MSDELPFLKAAEYVRIIFADLGVTHGRDVLAEICVAYLLWLGDAHGREAIDNLFKERLNTRFVRRANEKSLRLVVSNSAEIVHRNLAS